MPELLWRRFPLKRWMLLACYFLAASSADAQVLTLQQLVTPSTIIQKNGRTLPFALHGYVEFDSLAALFPYIDGQAGRWKGNPAFNDAARQQLLRELLRRGVESRTISMVDERPLELLVTHTPTELQQALSQVKEPVPEGYAEAFLAVQEKWKHSLNCWSASPSIPGRVLSNWYPIEEGIRLYGATYDSTEHFWQATKFHPEVTVADIKDLLHAMEQRNWTAWIARLDDDPETYLPNAYAVEFLRHNLRPERLRWFSEELDRQQAMPGERARTAQQRTSRPFRFTAYEEKVLWGDVADVFHLIYIFSPGDDPIRKLLGEHHFDGIYLEGRKMGFISEELRVLMLEIWKVKFLQMRRFGEVIRSIPVDVRLSHFLNDGDSPDIPIPIYIEYLNQIRQMAMDAVGKPAPSK